MSQFKVGDRVLCIDDDGATGLTVGAHYTVSQVDYREYLWFSELEPRPQAYLPHHFVPAPTLRDAKDGDKITVEFTVRNSTGLNSYLDTTAGTGLFLVDEERGNLRVISIVTPPKPIKVGDMVKRAGFVTPFQVQHIETAGDHAVIREGANHAPRVEKLSTLTRV